MAARRPGFLSSVITQERSKDLPTPPPTPFDISDVSSDVSSFSTTELCYERKMGDGELSYYLPSRANGVNDMYLHLGFTAPVHLVTPPRLCTAWAILRLRHPLLACKIRMHDYDDVRFVYHPPKSAMDAFAEAEDNLGWRSQTKDALIDSYLNGARTLSNDRISYLILSHSDNSLLTPPMTPSEFTDKKNPEFSFFDGSRSSERNYDLLICAAHFVGDGMALHQFAHDFFTLIGSESDLERILTLEWEKRWGNDAVNADPILPISLEEALPSEGGLFQGAVAKVDFQRSQGHSIGGHCFPRESGKLRRTVVPTISIDEGKTKTILKGCKTHGVSISAALFALCNIVWSRMHPDNPELPIMMYSALNVRPYIPKPPPSYWFLAIGYFNVVLPSFIPKALPTSKIFWHRARSAKDQSSKAMKNSMTVYRIHQMAKERGMRARAWGKEDDEKANGTWIPHAARSATASNPSWVPPKAPSNALIGLSLLGNLDGIYKHQDFKNMKMHTLTSGSRQRNGGMLLFGYTFAGKLWLSLGYDEEGFEKEVVTEFWEGLLKGVDEFLVEEH